jgi:hypothetical protein
MLIQLKTQTYGVGVWLLLFHREKTVVIVENKIQQNKNVNLFNDNRLNGKVSSTRHQKEK